MHEIDGDGYLSSGGHRYFADEDLPTRKATQVTHQWANAVQEEIANVIRAEGITLNTSSESYAAMNQLNAAIDHKVADEATARIAADASEASTRAAAVAGLDGRTTTLEGEMVVESGRNDTQDGQITTLQGQTALFDHSGAVKGDTLSFDTADSRWHPAAGRSFPTRVFCDSMNKGLASPWYPGAEYPITSIQVYLKGRYATPGDGGVPQGNTLFQTYELTGSELPEAIGDAVYRGGMWHIRGSVVVVLPATIANGYLGYSTNVFQALYIKFNCATQLWYGPTSVSDHNGVGRTRAIYKRFTNTSDYVHYEGDQHGHFICIPFGVITPNGIWIGNEDTWFSEFTNADARAMPGIFTPSKKYAISFDVVAPSWVQSAYEYPT